MITHPAPSRVLAQRTVLLLSGSLTLCSRPAASGFTGKALHVGTSQQEIDELVSS